MRYAAMLFAASVVAAGCGGDLTGSNIKLCTSATAYTLGTTATGTVDNTDCKDASDHVGDIYSFNTTGTTGFKVDFSGNGFKPNVIFYQGTVANMASAKLVADVDASEFPSFRVMVPASSYFFVMSSENTSGGSYSITTTTGMTQAQGCPLIFTIPGGMSINGSISAVDCAGLGGSYHDLYLVTLTAGQTINVAANITRGGGLNFRLDGTTTDLVTKPINVAAGGATSFSYTSTGNQRYIVDIWSTPSQNPVEATYSLSY